MNDPIRQRLHHFQLPIAGALRAERFELWRDVVGGVFDVRATASQVAAFEGDFRARLGRRYLLCHSASSNVSLGRSPEAKSGVERDHFALCVLTGGQVVGLAGAEAVKGEPGDVLFIDLTQGLSLNLSPRGDLAGLIGLWARRARILPLFSDEHALHGLTLKAASPAGALIGASLRAFDGLSGEIGLREFDALADGVLALAGKAVAPVVEGLGLADGAAALASYVTIRRYIDRNLGSPALDAEAVAQAFGLSRASLYRLFEPAGGVATYIRKARLNRAFQEITAPELANRRIGQIAYRLGFKNVSAFNRLFRDVYKVSPGKARQRSAPSFAAPAIAAYSQSPDSLASWLDDLDA